MSNSLATAFGNKLLVVVPHADDEVLGAGGILARAAAEKIHVIVLCVALGDTYFPHREGVVAAKTRREEFMAALQQLDNGNDRIRGHSLYDNKESYLDTVPIRDLITALDRLVFEEQPTALLLPCPSVHQDHEITFRACMAACRPTPSTPLRFVAMHEYPAAIWNHHPLPDSKMYIDVTKWIDAKVRALECHRSQLRDDAHLFSVDTILHWSRAHAKAVGLSGHAEVIRVLRWRV